jgi:large subunit ribosomal protein L25
MATATADKNEKSLEAQSRNSGGKNDARRLRKSGLIPAVLYGAGLEPLNIAVDPKQVSRILHSEQGHNTIFDMTAGGDSGKVMIVDWQYEPIKGALLHVDLKRIAMDKLLTVSVPITMKGEAPGVKLQGGILEQMMREVEIECLPADIPSHFDADVSQLVFGQTLRVADLPHSDKIKFITDENQAVAHVTAVKEVAAPTPAESAEAAAAPAEPEVIKKGKTEAEGEGEGEKSEKKK